MPSKPTPGLRTTGPQRTGKTAAATTDDNKIEHLVETEVRKQTSDFMEHQQRFLRQMAESVGIPYDQLVCEHNWVGHYSYSAGGQPDEYVCSKCGATRPPDPIPRYRFSHGGLVERVGLQPDEVPVILKQGEEFDPERGWVRNPRCLLCGMTAEEADALAEKRGPFYRACTHAFPPIAAPYTPKPDWSHHPNNGNPECRHRWVGHERELASVTQLWHVCKNCGMTLSPRDEDNVVKEKPDPFFGRYTIYGVEGEHNLPYMTRYWIGRLRLHIFHRGDNDPDPHDHPWAFWTFPLTSYIEEVVGFALAEKVREYPREIEGNPQMTSRRVVRAFRLHYRPATHTHRVIGRARRPNRTHVDNHWRVVPGKIVTIVWRGGNETKRPWGFLKNRDGKWCWIAWKEYVYRGGKHAPCE